MAQGCIEENISCYYTIDDKIKNVGYIPISYSNEGSLPDIAENWEAKYFFIDNGLELPKILLNIKGKKDGSNFFKTEYYVYNGSKYVKE
ncbi:MAG: hypothetical protein DRI94_09425 [Bacteroidetes bacterium]|nr:MAG: hypothetical protein DRI94_09425 [Bacteroidota bacterium]